MYQKRRRRRRNRRRLLYLIAALLLILAPVTIVLCGLSNQAAEVEPEIPTIDIYETIQPQINVAIPLPTLVPCESTAVTESTTEPEPEDAFRYYEHIPFEYDMQRLLWAACEETGCPYELALAVIFRESTYRNVSGDSGNSIGYMQVQPRWHQERMDRLGVTDLSDPLSNFRVGCDLLAELIEKYESVESALTCYNTGSPGESGYASRVLAYMNETFFAEEVDGK